MNWMKIKIIANTVAWTLLIVVAVLLWGVVTERVDFPGHDRLTRIMDNAGKGK